MYFIVGIVIMIDEMYWKCISQWMMKSQIWGHHHLYFSPQEKNYLFPRVVVFAKLDHKSVSIHWLKSKLPQPWPNPHCLASVHTTLHAHFTVQARASLVFTHQRSPSGNLWPRPHQLLYKRLSKLTHPTWHAYCTQLIRHTLEVDNKLAFNK